MALTLHCAPLAAGSLNPNATGLCLSKQGRVCSCIWWEITAEEGEASAVPREPKCREKKKGKKRTRDSGGTGGEGRGGDLAETMPPAHVTPPRTPASRGHSAQREEGGRADRTRTAVPLSVSGTEAFLTEGGTEQAAGTMEPPSAPPRGRCPLAGAPAGR